LLNVWAVERRLGVRFEVNQRREAGGPVARSTLAAILNSNWVPSNPDYVILYGSETGWILGRRDHNCRPAC